MRLNNKVALITGASKGIGAFEVFSSGLTYKEGYLYIEDKHGIGVDASEEIAHKYDYKRNFLPTLRDREGAVHNW